MAEDRAAGPRDGRLTDVVFAILDAVDAVPKGQVATYGEIAAVAGATPRQVGQVLSRHGEEVPWQRIIMANGVVATHLATRQLALLAEEGVPLCDGGTRVDLAALRHDPSQQGLFSAEELETGRPAGSGDPRP